jgi:hypothetical protein
MEKPEEISGADYIIAPPLALSDAILAREFVGMFFPC